LERYGEVCAVRTSRIATYLVTKEMGDEMLRKFEVAVAAAAGVVPKSAVRTIGDRRRSPIPTPRMSLLNLVGQERATRE
jgi:hypothetical protein